MNDLAKIERQARALMTAHGVGSLGFEFDGGKKRIGATKFVKVGTTHLPKKITLSRHFAAGMTDEEIYDTVMHEIAHAKAGFTAGHGPVWQKHARALGIKADRCKTVSVTIEKAWEGFCSTCGEKRGAQHRAPLRVYACATPQCKKVAFYDRVLVWKKNGVPVRTADMPLRFQQEWNSIMLRKFAV